jgi:ribose 5-phosphate isomerase B
MKIAIAADHGGFPLKQELLPWLKELGCETADLGAHECIKTDDYPDYALAVARVVAGRQAERGIVICGSGVGAAVAANKVRGVRASVCHDTYSARQGVEHDDLNVLCLGARVVGIEVARELVKAFVNAHFIQNERYLRRLRKLEAIEGGKA